MKTLIAIVTVLTLTACGKEQASNAPAPTPTDTPAIASVTPTPTPVPPLPTVQVTYYALSVALYISGPTGIGYCAVYSGQTYCWDDGLHNAYSFFGAENGLNSCNGVCTGDTFATPIVISSNVQGFINANLPANRNPSNVLTNGIATTVTCTLNGTVDCGNFVIDTNQVPL